MNYDLVKMTMPKAWNEMIERTDARLLEALADKTEALCGYRPETYTVTDFFLSNRERLLLNAKTESSTFDLKKAPRGRTSGRKTGRIAINIEGQTFEAEGIPTLFHKILVFVVDNGTVEKLLLPWGIGAKRYFIFKGDDPKHIHGKRFFKPVSYKGYNLEAHVNREQGIKNLTAFLHELGYTVKVEEM
jgi:hypothetical protein